MLIRKKTKIIATVGPSTENEKMLRAMFKAGLNIMRLNFSHGSHKEHQNRIDIVKAIAQKSGKPFSIIQDLSGPKIRLGDFYTEKVTLSEGKIFTLTTEKIIGDEKRVHINYPRLPKELKAGNIILLDDGKKRLQVISTTATEIKCRVIIGGEVKGRRGVNTPGAYLKVSSLTLKDRKDLKLGIKNKVDFIALSFVRRPEDILELRGILKKANSAAQIIAKIETQEAVENIDAIIEATDVIMVARGDLAIEIGAENVPLVQKMIIRKCNLAGKPVITATQMLESMIKSPVPTRAEVSDVANAILDGTDAIMLSEETALGQYPVEAIEVMARVAMRTENDYLHKQLLGGRRGEHNGEPRRVTDSVTSSAVYTAEEVGARFIVVLTSSGFTARMLSRYKPHQTIVVLTPNKATYQQTTISFGCYPVLIKQSDDFEKVLAEVRKFFLSRKLVKKGEKVVITTGMPFGKVSHLAETNILLVEEI